VTHPAVQHPRELLDAERAAVGRFNTVVSAVASSALGSMALFWVTFLVPLLTLPLPDGVKLIVSIVFSSWFQAWALPVLQHAANAADAKRDAKADVDHAAQVHIATVTDDTNRIVRTLADQLGINPDTGENRLPRPRY
jgi:Co/Zn/Cd efflux system component